MKRMKNVARGLGWFSIGLGLTQVLAPRQLGKLIGVGDHRGVMRALGAREVLTGIGILTRRRPKAGLWARVGGDALDLALLTRAVGSYRTEKRRIAGALGMVAAIGILDYLSARKV